MARRDQPNSRSRQVYFEHVAIGASVKVSAIDAESGIEVSIAGPRTTSQKELERIALQKLLRAMEREAGG